MFFKKSNTEELATSFEHNLTSLASLEEERFQHRQQRVVELLTAASQLFQEVKLHKEAQVVNKLSNKIAENDSAIFGLSSGKMLKNWADNSNSANEEELYLEDQPEELTPENLLQQMED